MKLSVKTKPFADAMAGIARIANDKSPNPLLANVLMVALGDKLELSATNFSLDLETSVGAEIESDGAITVNASRLASWSKSVNSDEIRMTLGKDNRLHLTAGNSRSSLQIMDSQDFPAIRFEDPKRIAVVDSVSLKNILNQVRVAVAQDENRPALHSILLEFTDGKLVVVGGDGQRMARATIDLDIDENFIRESLLINSENANEVIGTILSRSENIELLKSGHKVLFKTSDTVLSSLTVNAEYVDYKQLLDNVTLSGNTIIDKSKLLDAIKRAKLFLSDDFRFIELAVDPSGFTIRTIETEASANEYGSSEDVIPNIETAGEPFNIQFSLDFLEDAINGVFTNGVELHLGKMGIDPTNALVVGVVKENFSDDVEDTRHFEHLLAPRA